LTVSSGLAELGQGQLLRWEILSDIPPEVYDGQTIPPSHYDRLERYYLGLFGLELLLGHKPVDVKCFKHLQRKEKFFANPHNFVVDVGKLPWTEDSPALAFIMGRLLARDPEGRYRTAREASRELAAVADELLPDSLRDELEEGYEAVGCVDFANDFYDRLFDKRPGLRCRFSNIKEHHQKFVDALVDLMGFNPAMKHSRFLKLANQHKGKKLSRDDIEAFRWAFLGQIGNYFQPI